MSKHVVIEPTPEELLERKEPFVNLPRSNSVPYYMSRALRLGYDIHFDQGYGIGNGYSATYPKAMHDKLDAILSKLSELDTIKAELAAFKVLVKNLSKLITDEQYRRIAFSDMKETEKILNKG